MVDAQPPPNGTLCRKWGRFGLGAPRHLDGAGGQKGRGASDQIVNRSTFEVARMHNVALRAFPKGKGGGGGAGSAIHHPEQTPHTRPIW